MLSTPLQPTQIIAQWQQEQRPARQQAQCVLGSILDRRRDAEHSRPAQVSAALIEFWTFKQNCTQSAAATDRTKTVEFEWSSPHQQRLDLTASKLLKWHDPQLVLGTPLFLPYKQRMIHTVYFWKRDTVYNRKLLPTTRQHRLVMSGIFDMVCVLRAPIISYYISRKDMF